MEFFKADGLVYFKKWKSYFNYLKILDLYPLLEKFLFKWGLVIKYNNLYNLM